MKAEDKQKDRITTGARQKDRTIAERGRRTGWTAVFPTGTNSLFCIADLVLSWSFLAVTSSLFWASLLLRGGTYHDAEPQFGGKWKQFIKFCATSKDSATSREYWLISLR